MGGRRLGSSQAAPSSDYPFENNVFWCNIFPPEVYAALDELWVPSEFMYKDKRTGHSKMASHKNADQRWKTTLDDYLRIKDDKGARCVHASLRFGVDYALVLFSCIAELRVVVRGSGQCLFRFLNF